MIFRASLIATPSGRLPQKRFTKKDPGSMLYRVSWLFLTSIVTSISCAFSTRSSLLQILGNSSRHHSVPMLLSLSSVTDLSLLFGLCSVHAVIQVPPDGVVGSRNYCCHSFAACTVDVTVCFICQTVSALTSGLSRYFAQLTPCWLHLAYFGQKTGCWRISCHHHPQSSPSPPWDFLSVRYFPSMNLSASCLSMKSATHVP